MILTTDGSRANALFARFDPKTAAMLRQAIGAAIAKATVLTTEACYLADVKHVDLAEAVGRNAVPIENTAMDAAAEILADRWPHTWGNNASTGTEAGIAAAAAGAAIIGGMKPGAVRRDLYRAGSLIGDAEAIVSGNPRKIIRRGAQHIFWRAFGKLGRGIFRGIGGRR